MDSILYFIDTYGLYMIFVIIFLEYSCFPLPSEVVLPLAGAIGYSNNINPIIMILLSVVSGLFGSLICYYLGFFGSKKLFKKNKKKEIEESNSFYDQYGNIAISAGRVIPLCRTYISFVAGVKKHKIAAYIIYTAIGITVWNSCLILLGYFFYDNIELIATYYDKYKIIIILALIIIFIIIIIKKCLTSFHKSS